MTKSPEEHYQEQYELFMQIPEEKLAASNMPQEEAMQEGKRVSALAAKYSDRLLQSDIKPEHVYSVDARAEAYAYSVAACDIYVHQGPEFMEQYLKAKKVAYALRTKALKSLEYIFRHDKKALERIAVIKTGLGNADLHRDMLSIHKLCTEKEKFLAQTSFDRALPEKAEALFQELANLDSQIDINPKKVNEAKEISAKAWTWLSEALEEIYAAGRYVFMDEPEIEELFYRDYLQELQKNAIRKKNQEEGPLEV